jgi:hypothetical protein
VTGLIVSIEYNTQTTVSGIPAMVRVCVKPIAVYYAMIVNQFPTNVVKTVQILSWCISKMYFCKLDQWKGYITVLVVNHGIIKSISIITAVIHPMIKYDVDQPLDGFRQEAKWMLAIRDQFSTLSALELRRIHHLSHAQLPEKHTYCLPDGNQSIRNTLQQIQSGGDHKALQSCPLLIE